jgi:uncharacterized protein (DUF1015 family)
MATLTPFRALRPIPADASRIAAVPYDVVNTDEARALAEGNPLSFLRVSRAEIELPPGMDPHADAVYDRAVSNFAAFRRSSLVVEEEASVYLYRLRMGNHEQTGVAGCWALDEYDRDVIKKHERTRRDKEDDRTRHMIAIGAQTGPVFLTYRASARLDEAVRRLSARPPLFDFEAPDGVRHTVWSVGGADRDALVEAFEPIPSLYIADGHHRAASAARARDQFCRDKSARPSIGDNADFTTFLGVAFPHDQVQILAYNRIVKDLGGRSSAEVLEAAKRSFDVQDGPASPARRGEVSAYLGGTWHTLRARSSAGISDPIRSLDVSVLQDQLLAPVLGIADVTTDKRIDFVGGARGTAELEALVRAGKAAIAFSMFPVSVSDLIAVSDAGEIMPPKSTWFEPKLRDGLLSHLI